MSLSIQYIKFFRFLLFICLFGMPGILQFDRSGITQDYGLFNIQSISRIIIYLSIFVIVFWSFIYKESYKLNLKAFEKIKIPFLYYCVIFFTSIFVLSSKDIILSAYFIFEWLILLFIIYLYHNALDGLDINTAIQDIKIIIWLKIFTTLFVLIVAPKLVLMGDSKTVYRIGGYFINPNHLGFLSSMLALYYMFYNNKTKIYSFFVVLFLTLLIIITNSRGALFSFILAFTYTLIYSKNIKNYLIMILLSFFMITFFYFNIDYIYRGLDISNIISLSERIPLWYNYYLEFIKSPIIGYGYIAGIKNMSLIISKAHWIAPHAHNDLIQAFLSGGIIVGFYSLFIYYLFFKSCFGQNQNNVNSILLRGWFIQIICASILMPLISYKLSLLSSIVWIIIIASNRRR